MSWKQNWSLRLHCSIRIRKRCDKWRARQQEKKLITEFHLLAQSQLRGECVEERIGQQLFNSPEEVSSPGILPSSTVHQLSRLDRRPLKAVSADKSVKIDELAESPAELILFSSAPPPQVNEFDEEEKEAVALSNYPREIE